VRDLLQWGRDQLIAEFFVPGWGTQPYMVLQWGRDQLIAELLHKSAKLAKKELASMGPRSADRGILRRSLGSSRRSLLQWGRDQLIAEFYCLVGGDTASQQRFNGAAIS